MNVKHKEYMEAQDNKVKQDLFNKVSFILVNIVQNNQLYIYM